MRLNLPEAKPVKDDAINVIAYVKGKERYIVLFTDSQRPEALQTVGRWAANPELSLTWFDAAAMANRMKKGT